MKRPSFQFYPGDWTGNSNLKRCTHEEKGIWIDVLCVLHDQEEYGVVRWQLAELAQAVGATKTKLKRLVDKGVLKGADAGCRCDAFIFVPRSGRKNGAPITLIEQQNGPLWYSSRMVEDEHKRRVRGGLEDAPKRTPDPSPKPPIGEGFSDGIDDAPKGTPDSSPLTCAPGQAPRADPSSSSSSSVKKQNLKHSSASADHGDLRFEEFWQAWPHTERRVAKAECRKKWRLRGLDACADVILRHVEAMKSTRQWTDGYEPAPLTYLNQRRWEDGEAAATADPHDPEFAFQVAS